MREGPSNHTADEELNMFQACHWIFSQLSVHRSNTRVTNTCCLKITTPHWKLYSVKPVTNSASVFKIKFNIF